MAESRNTPPVNPNAPKHPDEIRQMEARKQASLMPKRGQEDEAKAAAEKRAQPAAHMNRDPAPMSVPSARREDKPPFEPGVGWLETADRYAAGVLDKTLTGLEECCTGENRADKMLAQNEKHHGHQHFGTGEHVTPGGSNRLPPAPKGKGGGGRGMF